VILVTPEEALEIRQWAADDDVPLGPWSVRLWRPHDRGPIRLVEASGRARCRACGELIEKGAEAILFGFDALAPAASRGGIGDAYLHPTCPEKEAP